VIYLIGSLRNPRLPELGIRLRAYGFDIFDDWFAAGPEADDCWQKYEQERGRSFGEALNSPAANNVFNFDKRWLDKANTVVLMMPAGKSGHLEFGYSIGRGARGFVFFPDGEPERWDVMYQFATGVAFNEKALVELLEGAWAH
jgi:hypothetical protein